MEEKREVFLTAEWRNLVMLNYVVDPQVLRDFVPSGTVLDSFEGKTFVSLVGFQFCKTRLFGSIRIPFHADFAEVNLRFYVRRKGEAGERRGVVFLAEIVPKWAVAQVARAAYGENYVCLPMKHLIVHAGTEKKAEYAWQLNGAWCRLSAVSFEAAKPVQNGSLEQFITEHYWGYAANREGDSTEYHVSHVPWTVCASISAGFAGDASALYGFELARVLQCPPDSAFIAEGSPVAVFAGKKIR